MLFTERQSSGVTSTGPLLECLESCDNEEPRHPVDSLPLSFLPNQRFVDVRNDATTNCSLEERVQFFISTNSKLQVTRGNALHLQVFRCISKDLCRRDSRTAARCTAAVAPTRPRLAVLDFRCRWRQPPGNTLNSAAAQTSKAEKGLVRHPARTRRLLLRRTAIQTALSPAFPAPFILQNVPSSGNSDCSSHQWLPPALGTRP